MQEKLKSAIFATINVIALFQVKLLARHIAKRGVINVTHMKYHTFPLEVFP